MNLTEKVKKILSDKGLSPSIFADEIGIQRSSMSHILAGRNKPSLEMVQKMIRRYPDLGLNWIMDDEDLPELKREIRHTESAPVEKKVEEVKPAAPPLIPPVISDKKVSKIIVFYSDGTFAEFIQC